MNEIKELKSDKEPKDPKVLDDLLTKLRDNISRISIDIKQFLELYQSFRAYKYFLLKKINENYFIENTVSYNEIITFENILKKSQKIFNKVKFVEDLNEKKMKSKTFNLMNNRFNDLKEKLGNFLYQNDSNQSLLGNKRKPELNAPEYEMEFNDPLQEILGKEANLTKEEINNLNQNNETRGFTTCYVCKKKLDHEIHEYYSSMCVKCGELNWKYRNISINLNGRIAVITGGRIKIGYHTALKLLNFGSKVIITTRFPRDALNKFKKEENYENFKENLFIYQLDLRSFNHIQQFISYLYKNFPYIDILINNAAQTISREKQFYDELIKQGNEELPLDDKKRIIKLDEFYHSNDSIICLSELKKNNILFPKGILDYEGQQLDLNAKSSWSLEADEISFKEFAEAQVINSWAPFYISCQLKPLMNKSSSIEKFIINVTSQEGFFNQNKQTTHPHTNMAKASLNMFTATSGNYFKKDNIFMCSVDPGWVSYMSEYVKLFGNESKKTTFLNIPLDYIDGAMRVLQPVYEGIENKIYFSGCLLKNYKIYSF
jgi:NAD(P)-dependent dehydrogenase (short-subunit alcohol dehydrogenase family)